MPELFLKSWGGRERRELCWRSLQRGGEREGEGEGDGEGDGERGGGGEEVLQTVVRDTVHCSFD